MSANCPPTPTPTPESVPLKLATVAIVPTATGTSTEIVMETPTPEETPGVVPSPTPWTSIDCETVTPTRRLTTSTGTPEVVFVLPESGGGDIPASMTTIIIVGIILLLTLGRKFKNGGNHNEHD